MADGVGGAFGVGAGVGTEAGAGIGVGTPAGMFGPGSARIGISRTGPPSRGVAGSIGSVGIGSIAGRLDAARLDAGTEIGVEGRVGAVSGPVLTGNSFGAFPSSGCGAGCAGFHGGKCVGGNRLGGVAWGLIVEGGSLFGSDSGNVDGNATGMINPTGGRAGGDGGDGTGAWAWASRIPPSKPSHNIGTNRQRIR